MTTTIEEIASENGLELIETTAERSGYPRGLQKAIIGFDTFDEAEKLAKEYGLDIEIFTSATAGTYGIELGTKPGNRSSVRLTSMATIIISILRRTSMTSMRTRCSRLLQTLTASSSCAHS